MNPSVIGDFLLQTDHRLFELGALSVSQQVLQEGVLRLAEQIIESIRIRGVARFRLLGLRHVEFIEQHGLQLFWRTEVDGVADSRVRVFCALVGFAPELVNEVLQLRGIDVDADSLHLGQHCLCRHFNVVKDRQLAVLVKLLAQQRRQSRGEVGSPARCLVIRVLQKSAGVFVRLCGRDSGTALGEFFEFVAACIRHQQIGGKLRVGPHAHAQTVVGKRFDLRFSVVHSDLRVLGKQAGDLLFSFRAKRGHIDKPCAVTGRNAENVRCFEVNVDTQNFTLGGSDNSCHIVSLLRCGHFASRGRLDLSTAEERADLS